MRSGTQNSNNVLYQKQVIQILKYKDYNSYNNLDQYAIIMNTNNYLMIFNINGLKILRKFVEKSTHIRFGFLTTFNKPLMQLYYHLLFSKTRFYKS